MSDDDLVSIWVLEWYRNVDGSTSPKFDHYTIHETLDAARIYIQDTYKGLQEKDPMPSDIPFPTQRWGLPAMVTALPSHQKGPFAEAVAGGKTLRLDGTGNTDLLYLYAAINVRMAEGQTSSSTMIFYSPIPEPPKEEKPVRRETRQGRGRGQRRLRTPDENL